MQTGELDAMMNELLDDHLIEHSPLLTPIHCLVIDHRSHEHLPSIEGIECVVTVSQAQRHDVGTY
jgi:hypothetical protein